MQTEVGSAKLEVGSDGGKPWYASKTIWGLIIAGAAMAAQRFLQTDVTAADQNELVNHATTIGEIVGMILALWGRIAARKAVRILPGPPLPLLLVAAVALFAATGCTSHRITPQQQVNAAHITYNGALQQLIALRQQGVIDDDAYRKIEPLRAAAWEALGQMHVALETQRHGEFQYLLTVFHDAVNRLIAAELERKRAVERERVDRPASHSGHRPTDQGWAGNCRDHFGRSLCLAGG